MNKPIAVTAGFALGLIALALVATPTFVSYRMQAPQTVALDAAPRQGAAPAPAARPAKRLQEASRPAMFSSPKLAYDLKEKKVDGEVPHHSAYAGRNRFESVVSNPIKVAREEPVSTFSIDVDTASYAFVRRALNEIEEEGL